MLIALLTGLLTLPILSTDIYLPSLNEIGNFYHANTLQVQLTLTGYFFTFAIVQLIYGSLSDCFGRKPVCLLTLLIYSMVTLLCAFSTSIHMLIFLRCLQALGAGSAILTFAIIRDLYEGRQVAKIIAYMSAVVALSPIISPIIGSYIQSCLAWQWDFILLALIGLILLLLCYWILPETNRHIGKTPFFFKQLFLDYRRLLNDRNYMLHSLAAAFAFGALFAYVSGFPYVLNLMGYSPLLFGWIFAVAAIGYVLGAFTNGKLVCFFGMNLMGRIGIMSLVGGAIVMTLMCRLYPLNIITMVIPQIVCEFGIAIVISISVTKALQPIPHYAGAGSALLGFLRFLLAALSSYLTIRFHNATPLSLAFIILGFSLLSLFSLSMVHDKLFGDLIFDVKTWNKL